MNIRKFRCAKEIVLGLGMLLLSVNNAWAGYTCTGPVSGVSLAPDGAVWAASFAGLNWLSMCSISSTTNGVSTDACKGIYAMLLTAQATGRNVTLWFNDDPNTCASHLPWTPLTGWYFGPTLN